MLEALRGRFPNIFSGTRINVASSIPTSAGLGSSAALCVGLLRLARQALGMPAYEPPILFEEALVLEAFFMVALQASIMRQLLRTVLFLSNVHPLKKLIGAP